jgi:hypothetical protein
MPRILAAAMAATALAALTVHAAPTPSSQPSPGAFPPYMCNITLADASGAAWSFDLLPVAGLTLNYTTGGNPSYVYSTSPCGIPAAACDPANFAVQWPYAPGIQYFGNNCELLGQGLPMWQLLDSSNASAGLSLMFATQTTTNGDPDKCPYDPVTGTEVGRTVVHQHACDPAVPAGTVVVSGVSEGPTCTYNVQMRSAAACAVSAGTPNPPLPPPGPPVPTTPGRDASYFCHNVELADASGTGWSFSFDQLYTAAGYNYSVSQGVLATLQICGTGPTACTPNYPVASTYGVVTQFFGSPPPAGTSCFDENGMLVPCTLPCEILAASAPQWSLQSNTNGGSGGVIAVFDGVPSLRA